VPLSYAPTEGADEQVRRRKRRPDERYQGRNRGERDEYEPDQGETRHDQEEQRRRHKRGAGDPFDSIAHGSTTFLV
jgi:hypothetical protein